MARSKQTTSEDGKRQGNRRTFSVSKGFSDVHKILDELPDNEMSRFVCEAIRHYDKVKNNPNWMTEQMQHILQTQAQLQQMIAGFGNAAFPNQPSPSQPIYQQQYGVSTQQVQMPLTMQMPYPMHMYPPPSEPITPTQESSLTTVEHEEITSAQEVIEQSMKQVSVGDSEVTGDSEAQAVEQDQRFNKQVDHSPEKTEEPAINAPRRTRSAFAKSLAHKSLGKVDK
ncbi:hypothetical protein ACFVS2_21150 [Brevibacillus sp. NPDC058079]|uniref:hypothetical protein n=1 Tax=Brevibacillus sp. NPDC058079 TaxID=3346330 RepID=UPI0036EE3252